MGRGLEGWSLTRFGAQIWKKWGAEGWGPEGWEAEGGLAEGGPAEGGSGGGGGPAEVKGQPTRA